MDYTELVKSLRICASEPGCDGCKNHVADEHYEMFNSCTIGAESLMKEAADAIEELQASVAGYEAETDVEFVKENGHERIRFVPKWIPVTERLPENNEAVLIVWVNHDPVSYYEHIKDKPETAVGVYYYGKWYWWSTVTQDILAEYGKWEPDEMDKAIEVTHWMPLPTPPKEETE